MKRTIHRLFAGLLLALTAAMTPQPAEARREWPLFGGGLGDAGVTVQCPPGEAIVGFAGRAGAWMDQVRILCAQVQADGTFGEPHPGSDGVGGPGGAPMSQVCDRQSRMQDVTIDRSDDGKKISTLGFHCVTRDGQQTGNIVGGSGSYCPSADRIIATGCDPGENATMQSCPNEQFVGAKIRFGKDVNAIGFICDEVAVAAPPPPPAAAPPPAPEKPIKRTGKSGDAVAINHNLGDVPWQVTPSVGAPFKLVLHEDSDTGTITGEMRFEHARNNGTLAGSTSGGGMYRFTYEQPDVGISGSGSMMAFNEKILAGEVTTKEDPPRKIQWKGAPVSIAPRGAFRGEWSVVTDKGAHYKLTLILQGEPDGQVIPMPVAVTGVLAAADGADGGQGALQGLLQPGQRSFNFNYGQKNGSSGSGIIALSYDGSSIEGAVDSNDGAHSVWKGERVESESPN